MTIDCMTCLVREAQGVPCEGAHRDDEGTTHGTLLWIERNVDVVLCTLEWDDEGWCITVASTQVPR